MKTVLNFVVAAMMILQTGFLAAIPISAEGEVTGLHQPSALSRCSRCKLSSVPPFVPLLLTAYNLIEKPTFTLVSAAEHFRRPTQRVNEL